MPPPRREGCRANLRANSIGVDQDTKNQSSRLLGGAHGLRSERRVRLRIAIPGRFQVEKRRREFVSSDKAHALVHRPRKRRRGSRVDGLARPVAHKRLLDLPGRGDRGVHRLEGRGGVPSDGQGLPWLFGQDGPRLAENRRHAFAGARTFAYSQLRRCAVAKRRIAQHGAQGAFPYSCRPRRGGGFGRNQEQPGEGGQPPPFFFEKRLRERAVP